MGASLDIIIPAMNEGKTIGAVVAAARKAKSVRNVLVVNDGSIDNTAEEAQRHGAIVVGVKKNRGKGKAMRLGLQFTNADYVGFVDADLKCFSPYHLEMMWQKLKAEGLSMVCGLRDYGFLRNAFQQTRFAETITGERICSRWLLDCVPAQYWDGYKIEAALNGHAKALGAQTGKLILPGLSIVNKTEKQGLIKGLASHARMFGEVGRTIEEMKRIA